MQFWFWIVLTGLVTLGCNTEQSVDASLQSGDSVVAIAPPKSDHDYLESRIVRLEESLGKLKEILESDPQFCLRLLDRDLDAIEHDAWAHGSFSDYFVPYVVSAYQAGATRAEITARIDRLVALAYEGKHLSSYDTELWQAGGEQAIRDYFGQSIQSD